MRERVSSSYYGTAKAETDQVVSIFELQYKGEQKILKFNNSNAYEGCWKRKTHENGVTVRIDRSIQDMNDESLQ